MHQTLNTVSPRVRRSRAGGTEVHRNYSSSGCSWQGSAIASHPSLEPGPLGFHQSYTDPSPSPQTSVQPWVLGRIMG